MKKPASLFLILCAITLSGCSDSNTTASQSTEDNNVKQDTVLKGYKDALDKAKAVQTLAADDERRKKQAISGFK